MNQLTSVREEAARAERARPLALASDLVALTKPRVTGLVMATAAVGLQLAPGTIALPRALSMLFTTALLVGAANALNCWLERDSDAFMRRTRGRPLPARRLDPQVGFVFGAVLGVASLPVLAVAVNSLTGLLGAVALFSYVWLYTPLKFKSPHAMIVGAVPGALPPLMGWTAVTGDFGAGGLALFAIVFVWQMPHVIGLSIYRRQEYAAAGIRVLPLVHGPRVSQYHAIGWALLMVPVSLAPAWLGLGGAVYLVAALVASAVYLGSTLLALVRPEESVDRWGRRVFFVSLLYLPLLLCALLLDQGI
jgi:protoheme IX farnesyltransferase